METWSKVTRTNTIPRDLGKAWMDSARYKDLKTMKRLLQDHGNSNPELLVRYDGSGTSYGFIGNTALHWAAANNNIPMMELLLKAAHCVVNQQNHGGSTPLHSACSHGSTEAVVVLMKNGVNPSLVDCCNDTAEDVVPEDCRRIITPLLRNYELALQMKQTDPSQWRVSDMKQILATAGKRVSVDVVERSDLIQVVQSVLQEITPVEDTTEDPQSYTPTNHDTQQQPRLADQSDEVQAEAAKEKGNELYKAGDYKGAIRMYTLALRIVPNDAVFLNNRSACYLKLCLFEKALADAQKALSIRPDWDKAQFRVAAALEGLKAINEIPDPSPQIQQPPPPPPPPSTAVNPNGAKKPWFECVLCENRTRDRVDMACCNRPACGTCVKRAGG
eukprot:PhF_6_TR15634/c0_g1_i1/m.24271